MRKFVRADSNTSIAGSSVVCGSEADDDPAATAPVTSCTMLATLLDSSPGGAPVRGPRALGGSHGPCF